MKRAVGIPVALLGLCFALGCEPNSTTPSTPSTEGQDPSRVAQEPCDGVTVTPGADLATTISQAGEGTTFCMTPGLYPVEDSISLKQGQQLIGTGSGVIISGAEPVIAGQRQDYWVVTGQTSLGTSGTSGGCRPVEGIDPEDMCVYNDQVFLDDVSLWQMPSLQELSPGEFYWDYTNNEIYLADDPSARKLEVSVAGGPIGGDSDVMLKNLVVEKFGNSAQSGAVSASSDWVVDDVEIRLNHGAGLHMGPHTVIRDSYIHHNGQLGIHGGQASCAIAQGLLVTDTEIAYNNTAGYNWAWEGGGTKWNYTRGLTVRNSYIHDNYGPGLWTDAANIATLIENNVVEDNYASGIAIELSYETVVRGNVTRRNGLEHPVQGDIYGAGIRVDQSRDVEVYNNIVEDNAAGITATHEPHEAICFDLPLDLTNLFVHGNTITQMHGIAAGVSLRDANSIPPGNRWESNSYRLGDPNGLHFYWSDPINADAWQANGQDVQGAFGS